MNKIKSKMYICGAVWLFAIPVFSTEPVVDFDGKSPDVKNIKTFIAENAPVLLSVPANKTDSELVVKREILTETGEWIELKPVGSWIDEHGTKYDQYTVKPNWVIMWSLRCPKGNWTAKKTYSFWNEQYGGHYHYDPPPPPLSVSSVSLSASTAPFHTAPSPIIFPEMKGNTTYYYGVWYPAFATKVQEQLEAYGACQGITKTNYIDVKIPGLVEMPEGQNYVLYNSETGMGYHPDNHYGTQKLIDNLKTIADGYRAVFPSAAPIQINDMSLPWGGIFDINQDWKRPFFGHDTGIDADIVTTQVLRIFHVFFVVAKLALPFWAE
ncbi:MAG: hypothetical protein KKH28_11550 [Elusimicrobia bacterium]|nr:hypothetical protein [Elusimicrobiota bacterium]